MKRYTDQLINGATNITGSAWLQTMNGGWMLAKDNLIAGIGTGNYRLVSYEGSLDGYNNVRPDVHPHNFYIQILLETGAFGFMLGVVFIWSIIWHCFKASFKRRENVCLATAWVIPFGIFWPISTSPDFFGQWNNVFMWSAIAFSLTVSHQTLHARSEKA